MTQRKHILFICTGNTCRSPMAMCLFNDRCARLGLAWRAESALFFTIDASKCTECEGENDSPMCVNVCPSGCISPA